MAAPTPPSLGGPYGPNGDSANPADKAAFTKVAAWALSAANALKTYAGGVMSHAQELVTAEATARSNADAAEVTARNAAIASAVSGLATQASVNAKVGLNNITGPFTDDAAASSTVGVGAFYYDSTGLVRRRMA